MSTSLIKIIVNGAKGRMGQESVKAILQANDLQLVGQTDHGDDLEKMIHAKQADVVVDFTLASVVFENIKKIISAGAHPVIGTTGLLPKQVNELQALCAAKQLGGIIAPNFSIAAVLMMQFSEKAAHYFPNVEIIEAHHGDKEEAPSGTAIKTAEMIAAARREQPTVKKSLEKISGARGAVWQNIPIHSIRLPGVVADQQVVFGNEGETLTIHHHTVHRQSFMAGVCLACRRVKNLNTLVYGLENILD